MPEWVEYDNDIKRLLRRIQEGQAGDGPGPTPTATPSPEPQQGEPPHPRGRTEITLFNVYNVSPP